MRVMITGNMGYVGPAVIRELRRKYPDSVLDGYDTGYFSACLTTNDGLPERLLDKQIFGDARDLSALDLRGYDAVVILAAISNDPMGERFAAATRAINRDAAVAVARAAVDAGVGNIVFASSCSVYGVAQGGPRTEQDEVSPVTAYAVSKVDTEAALMELGGDTVVTCLRFATACGMSARLRLDLVLNDFVACALTSGKITVLSDGSPWRPLIDVADMARAIDWAATRPASNGGQHLIVNAGTNSANYQVRDIARTVADSVPGCLISINTEAPADSRSYQVDFSRFAELAPDHQPRKRLQESVDDVIAGLRGMGFDDPDFRTSPLIRLQVLRSLIAEGRLSESLEWVPLSSPSSQQAMPKEMAR